MKVVVKWNGQEYNLAFCEGDTVFNLKKMLCKETGVRPDRQKLLGLKYKGAFKFSISVQFQYIITCVMYLDNYVLLIA